MSKPQITGIKHTTDGRSKLGGIVVKNSTADGIVRLTWGRIVEFSQHSWYLSAKVEYFKEGVPRTTRGGTTNTLVSCRVLMVASRISCGFPMHPTPESQRSVFTEICGMKTFWLANGPVRRQ